MNVHLTLALDLFLILMSFPLLPICDEEFKSAPKIITFLPYPPPGNEKLPLLSNASPYPEYLYLSTSAFLVKLTAQIMHFLLLDYCLYYH